LSQRGTSVRFGQLCREHLPASDAEAARSACIIGHGSVSSVLLYVTLGINEMIVDEGGRMVPRCDLPCCQRQAVGGHAKEEAQNVLVAAICQ
jgi:hypothetical protein